MRGTWAAAALMLAAWMLAGCSSTTGPEPSVPQSGAQGGPTVRAEVACPDALVDADADGDSGFGGWIPADRDVDLEPFDAAWLCKYSWTDATPEAGGESSPWTVQGDPVPIADGDLAAVLDALGRLELWTDLAGEIVCTLDLGPTWLLVLADGEQLTGVAFEEFGCGFTRLTDDPYAIAPGQSQTLPEGSYLGGDVLREVQALAGVAPGR